MKRVLLGFLLLCSISAIAQDDDDAPKFRFCIGTSFALPLGDLKESTFFGYGIQLQPLYSVAQNVDVFVQTGGVFYRGKTNFGSSSANNILNVPILGGARYRAGGFFVGGAAGYGLWIANAGSSNGFMFSPQLGYTTDRLEVGANYSSTSLSGATYSSVGFNVFHKF